MAQGKLKVKQSLGSLKKKKSKDKKSLGPKKGGKYIAPKKKNVAKQEKMKKNLQKTINASIERDAAQRAGVGGLTVIKVAEAEEATKGGHKVKKNS